MTIEVDPKALDAFWREAADELCLDPNATARHFSFGETRELANELIGEVLHGTKRATAGLIVEMEASGEPIPKTGELWIVTDGDGRPRAIIRSLEVRIAPFHEVDEAFAWDEGEGDRSLGWWRRAHIDYFEKSCERLGKPFSETLDVLFERFDVLWPKASADKPILRRPCSDEIWAAYHQLRRVDLFERYIPEPVYDPDFHENWTKDVFHFCLLAAGELRGCLQLRWLSATEAAFELVAIDKAWRGQGLGRRMLLYAEAFARLYGRQTLRVFTEPEAEPFYRKLGFEDGPDWSRKPLSARAKPLVRRSVSDG